MKFRTLLTVIICFTLFKAQAQTTSGTVGTLVNDPNAAPAETFNLKTTQKLDFSGMVQTRYQLFQDSTKIDAFDFRRARLVFRGDVGTKVGYRLQVEMANGPKVLDAVFTYKPVEYFNVNVGQSKTPYSYDNYYSPFTLLTISRTQLDNALSNREADLYGNNQGRDIGLWLTGKYSIGEEGAKRPILEYDLGVFNGAGFNVVDNNKDKDFGGFLRVSPVKNLWISGRAYQGFGAKLLANPDSTADRTRFGGDISYRYKSFLVEGEYLTATDDGEGDEDALKRSAYYLTLAYTVIPDKFQVAARLDNYDKNTEKDLDVVNKYVLAASWFFSKTTRIQLEYNLVREEDPDNQKDDDLFAIQFQAGF